MSHASAHHHGCLASADQRGRALDFPGTKVVVGDGPARRDLEARFPDVIFLGALSGEALAQIYASADVFVLPSLTDTFGIVMLEALASGLPVAAYPVTGPRDIVGETSRSMLDWDLRLAALAALSIPRETCRAAGQAYTWEASARQFFGNIREAHAAACAAVPHEWSLSRLRLRIVDFCRSVRHAFIARKFPVACALHQSSSRAD